MQGTVTSRGATAAITRTNAILRRSQNAGTIVKHLGWSPRELTRKAREIGACRLLGNAMILVQEDIDALMEATKPARKTADAAVKPVSADGSYQDLVRLNATLQAKAVKPPRNSYT